MVINMEQTEIREHFTKEQQMFSIYKKEDIWIQQCWEGGPNTKASCINRGAQNPGLLQTSKKGTSIDGGQYVSQTEMC